MTKRARKPMMRKVTRNPSLLPPMFDPSFYIYWYRLRTSVQAFPPGKS